MELQINNFKCFTKVEVETKGLTIFAGANGRGKSTAIQALLLLRTLIGLFGSFDIERGIYTLSKKSVLKKSVPVNGSYGLRLGNSSALINKQQSENEIIFKIQKDSAYFEVTFESNEYEPQLFLTVKDIEKLGELNHSIFSKEFHYLTAERIGPRIIQNRVFQEFPNTGFYGEFTAQVISMDSGLFKIDENRRFKDTKNPQLLYQANQWLDFILPGTRINTESSPNTNTVQIVIENEFTVSDPVLATNIGFGISYVLPIIVTCLVCTTSSTVIVENPEAHLHPGAQSKIGQFISKMSGAGINILVETHSDHFLNGVQISAAMNEIEPTNLVINFFTKNSESVTADVDSIYVTKGGELSKWPVGFFDQSQIDFQKLIMARNA